MQTHHNVVNMPPWDRDILMLKTLHALNKVYKSPYQSKMKYTVMEETPIVSRQQIAELVDKLNTNGVPDTVAYVSEKEVKQVSADLAKLGYDERGYTSLFQGSVEPISFVVMNLRWEQAVSIIMIHWNGGDGLPLPASLLSQRVTGRDGQYFLNYFFFAISSNA